jgi:hypothetical protein
MIGGGDQIFNDSVITSESADGLNPLPLWNIMFMDSPTGGTQNPKAGPWYPLWRDILNEHQTRPFHVMIGGGDQIFNDSVITESILEECGLCDNRVVEDLITTADHHMEGTSLMLIKDGWRIHEHNIPQW